MLALVHPVQYSTEPRPIDRTLDRSLPPLPRSSSALSSGRLSSARVSHWKQPATTTCSFQSSSSYFSPVPRRSASASSTVARDSSPARHNATHSSQRTSESDPSTGKLPPPDNPPIPSSPIPPPQIKLPPSPSSFDIHNYPSADLLRLLASLLTQIASTNDAISGSDPVATLSHQNTSEDTSRSPIWRSLTSASRSSLSNPASALTFHARNIPTIALESYLLRILKYCPTTNEVFVALLVYFDRMSRLASEATGRTFVIDSYNVHRLVIAGVTVASKFFSDVFYTNSRYAKVGFRSPIPLQKCLLKPIPPPRYFCLRSEAFPRQNSTNSNSNFFSSTTSDSSYYPTRCSDTPNNSSSSHNHSPILYHQPPPLAP
jgi:hypothetical protein